jgi:hypothetical protein
MNISPDSSGRQYRTLGVITQHGGGQTGSQTTGGGHGAGAV